MTDELDKKIGTQEATKLTPGSVFVCDVKIEPAKEGSKAKLVVFYCKHNDSPNKMLRLSNVMMKKVQGNNINIKRDALWYNLDDAGDIRKSSNLAETMRFYKKETIKQFIDTMINTEVDASGYLAIKAY